MLAATITFIACSNPFAPRLTDPLGDSAILGDQTTIEGVYENFRYAYIFKDTSVYGRLLADDFTFVYHNYDRELDLSWGRDEDVKSTYGLFQATSKMDLNWNEFSSVIGDSLLKDLARSFTLTITFSPADIVKVQGRASFRIARTSTKQVWRIRQWRDESNY
jgi:hypothetical protein